MSTALESVIKRLQNDWNFIENFLNDPDSALKEYNSLTTEELSALKANDSRKLMALGLESHEVTALSGAHSPTCPKAGTE